MAVEKMQFAIPMSTGCEVFPFIPLEEVDKEEPTLKANAAKEEGIIEASCCCGSDEDDVPYDKLWHDSDTEEDPDIIMAKIVERWDRFMKEEEARFPDQTYRVYYPGEYTADDKEGSDDEEYYRRKLEEGVLV